MYNIFIGNPYTILKENDTIVTTTNGIVNKNDCAVMGKGNALIVKNKFKNFKVDELLGTYLKKYGNRAFYLGKFEYEDKNISIATFPTKQSYRDNSDIELIKLSAKQIVIIANKFNLEKIYLPIPGCTNGNLKWSDVKNNLTILDSRFYIYDENQKQFEK